MLVSLAVCALADWPSFNYLGKKSNKLLLSSGALHILFSTLNILPLYLERMTKEGLSNELRLEQSEGVSPMAIWKNFQTEKWHKRKSVLGV